MISFLCPSGAALIIAWAKMWTSATVTAWTFRAGSISRPPMRNEVELHDGQADRPGPNAISGNSGSLWPQPSARHRGEDWRCMAPHWRQNHALGHFADFADGPPSASSSSRLVSTSRVPVSAGDVAHHGVFAAVVVLRGVAVVEILELVLGSRGELKLLIPFLEEVLAAASAGQHREEGVVVPTAVLLLGIGQRQEQLHRRGGFGAVQGHHHFVQATDEEMHLGPQQRFAALLGSGTQHQVGTAVRRWPGRLRAAGPPPTAAKSATPPRSAASGA